MEQGEQGTKNSQTENEGLKLLRSVLHDIIRTMSTVEEYVEKSGKMEKVMNAGVIDPSDPDQAFYIRGITMLGELVTRIKLYAEYVDSPIKKEGTLKLTSSGNILLGDEVFNPGKPFEFMINGEWEIGTMRKAPDGSGYIVFSPMMEEYKVQIDGLKVRIR